MKIEKVHTVLAIPDEWDNLATCFYQKKQFLLHSQNWNRCNQRYYLAYEDNRLVAGAVVYTLKLNLFTYSKFTLRVKMQITGIPCSVSCQGLIGNNQYAYELLEHIFSVEKGLCLALNLENTTGISRRIVVGKTVPAIVLKNNFSDWEEYLNKIRSDYRHRLRLVEEKSKDLKFQRGTCLRFNEKMYYQYLQVFDKSEAKLERLNLNFFKFLPDEFCLTTITIKDNLLGWFITLYADQKLYFFLGGLDYSLNEEYATYLRLLEEIIQLGIKLNVESIDLGQTAEEPKMRLGGENHKLYLAAFHKNLAVRLFLRSTIKLLEYKNKIPTHHVFKENV